MKFIVVEMNMKGLIKYLTFIFDKNLSHKVFYESSLDILKIHFEDCKYQCVSAGFVDMSLNDFYGESETLGIKCHKLTQQAFNSNKFNIFYTSKDKLIK